MNFSRVYALNFSSNNSGGTSKATNSSQASASATGSGTGILRNPPVPPGGANGYLAWINFIANRKRQQYDQDHDNWLRKSTLGKFGSYLRHFFGSGDRADLNRTEQDLQDMLEIQDKAKRIYQSTLNAKKKNQKLYDLHTKITDIDDLGTKQSPMKGEKLDKPSWLHLFTSYHDVYRSPDLKPTITSTGFKTRRVPRRSVFRQWIRGLWSRPKTHSIYQNIVNFNNKGRYSHVLYY